MSELANTGVSRRTLAKGAAWTVPAAAVIAVAPSVAASPIPPRGLNGWVTLRRRCGLGDDLFIDGQGNFTGGGNNDRGIWTFIPDPNASITDAQIVFFFNRGDLTFTNGSGAGWSNLVRDNTLDGTRPATGYYAYKTSYTGSWTYFGQFQAWAADFDPYWTANMGQSCGAVSAYARRSLTVNGETITFTRGPVYV